MTTVTIHAEDDFALALREYAARLDKSINQAVKDLLAPVLGLCKVGMARRENPWKSLCGCISREEASSIRKTIAEQHAIDEEMWK